MFIADLSEMILKSPVAWELSAAQRMQVVWQLADLGHGGSWTRSRLTALLYMGRFGRMNTRARDHFGSTRSAVSKRQLFPSNQL